MISVSDKFKEIMSSRLRPKAEPKITLSGKDADGNDVVIEWTSHDISGFTYKRGIDPVGRTLPYMHLSWKEIYTGRLGKGNIALKYNNVVPYMKVKLEINQNLNFWNFWKSYISKTWKSLFSQTWRDVMKTPVSETIEFPTLYLVSRPVVDGQTITWEARDFFYFLDNQQQIGFQAGINYRNPLRWFLLNERATFKNNDDFISSLDDTQKGITSDADGVVDFMTLFDGQTKNILKDYASARNYFWKFKGNKAELENFSSVFSSKDPVFLFASETMKKFPVVTENPNISAYSFTMRSVKSDSSAEYTLNTPDETFTDFIKVNRFVFKDWGYIKPSGDGFSATTISKEGLSTANSITVVPVYVTVSDGFINNEKLGEIFIENNTCNFDSHNSQSKKERVVLLDKYFNKTCNVLSFDCLPNFAVELGDIVSIETDTYDGDERIVKSGFVVEQTITFDGAFSQKNTIHEVV